MSATVSFSDSLTPALKQKLEQIGDKRPILQAMAGAAVSVAERAFADVSLRPKQWPDKKDGSTATLKGNPPVLARSLMALPPSADMIEVGSDRPYARAQNFGYEPRNLPARPFWPFVEGGDIFAPAQKAIFSAMKAAVEKALSG